MPVAGRWATANHRGLPEPAVRIGRAGPPATRRDGNLIPARNFVWLDGWGISVKARVTAVKITGLISSMVRPCNVDREWTLGTIGRLKAGSGLLAISIVIGCGGGRETPDARVASDNPYWQAMQDEAAPRYRLANQCMAIRSSADHRYVAVDSDGVVGLVHEAASATPFFMKPTALGRYVFYDPDARYLSLSADRDALADVLDTTTGRAGDQVSGLGDAVDINPIVHPVADGIDASGEAVAELGHAGAWALRAGDRKLLVQDRPVAGSEWTVNSSGPAFSIVSTAYGQVLQAAAAQEFDFVPSSGCRPYPEAELNAEGEPFRGRNPDGTVFGFADTHIHIGGSEMFGGRLAYGEPFHKFGIEHALGDCAEHHGPDGSLGLPDVVFDANRSTPQHDTRGWPSYRDWPSHSGQIHHQTYYLWLKRAWMGGLRLVVNHLVANEVLCTLWPIKGSDCNEMETMELQRQQILALQDYIDAQAGGPGKGFFRIVYDSRQARQAIEAGQMAVVLGTENEKVLGCGEYLGVAECTPESIDRDMDDWYERGVRAMFPIHILDNALGGVTFFDEPTLYAAFNVGNVIETGHPFAATSCDEVNTSPGSSQPGGQGGVFETLALTLFHGPYQLPPGSCQTNARGMSALGEYFVNRMIDKGIIIESDHAGDLSFQRMLDIAQSRGVPVISGHAGARGTVIGAAPGDAFGDNARRVLASGGFVSPFPDGAAGETVAEILELARHHEALYGSAGQMAAGLGSDINGVHTQGLPPQDAESRPLIYPFVSYAGDVVFQRQVTGERVFDFNTDGVAHYGLLPDYLADMQRQPGGEDAMRYLFRSAEAYLQLWERVEAAAGRETR